MDLHVDIVGDQRTNLRDTLFPEIEPYHTGMLPVSDLHTLYYETSGNPQGRPIAFVHGGPGSHTKPDHRRFFDPEFYKIILFDQRGGGKSTPSAELRENTTHDLVEDMEKLREHLKVDRWTLFGGSWGSTLTIAYSVRHPERVVGRIMRGIFLCRQSEINWFYERGGLSNIFPDAWEDFVAPIPKEQRGELVEAYHARLTSPSLETRVTAAKAWAKWEGSTSKLLPDPDMVGRFDNVQDALAFSRIENNFFYNNIWMPDDNYLLDQLKHTRDIPTVIVQGRYDMVCPMTTAWDVKKALELPDKRFHVIPDAGHSLMEPGILKELVRATEEFKTLR